MTKPHNSAPPSPMSDLELARAHIDHIDKVFPSLTPLGQELALVMRQSLEDQIKKMSRPIITHNGAEYAEMMGRA